MKTFSAKTILLVIMLGGSGLAIILYNQVLSLLSKLIGIMGYNWISICIVFIIGLLLAGLDIRMIAKDLRTTNSINELSALKMAKFFMGGFIGSYAGFLVMGVFALIMLLLLRTFFNLG